MFHCAKLEDFALCIENQFCCLSLMTSNHFLWLPNWAFACSSVLALWSHRFLHNWCRWRSHGYWSRAT